MRVRHRRRGRGMALSYGVGELYGYSPAEKLWMGRERREVRWLEARERQGRGNKFPLPIGAPPPVAISPRSSARE